MESLTPNSLDCQSFLENLFLLSPHRNYLVAYSGGMDSHILLHLLVHCKNQSNEPIHVRAVHIHHGLQEIADSWPKHCQGICDELDVPLEIVYLDLAIDSGDSLEAVARQGRYQALKNNLKKDEVLLTAHHQRDQAETFLLQLFRGAGVQGLASMPIVTDFAKGQHVRPLLGLSYDALQNYAQKNKLNYINDPSNQDKNFDRNFLRNDVIPQLKKHWSGLDKAISRSAKIQSETKQLLDEMAADLLSAFPDQKTLSIEHLLLLNNAKQKLVLRYWLDQSGFSLPSEVKLTHIINDVVKAKKDAQPLLKWQGVEIRRFVNQLYCLQPLTIHDTSQVITWDVQQDLMIESLGLTVKKQLIDKLDLQGKTVTIRFRQGGEKFYASSKNHSQSLKKVLNEFAVPPWLRDRLPLIYVDSTLVYIVGLKSS